MVLNRWKAAGIHFAISAGVATLVGALIYFVWYPQPYFQVTGGSSLMLLVMSVDIVIGPLLTLIVFKAGKKSLRFDLSVISSMQAAAFCYGLFVVSQARPVFIVARIDRFIPVAAADLDDADLARASSPQFATRSWTGPVLVGTKLPTNYKEKQDLLFSSVGGRDMEKQPRYFVPYQDVADSLLARARPLSELKRKDVGGAVIVEQFFDRHPETIDQYLYLPLRGRTEEYVMVLSAKTKLPITALPIDPW
jgi:hypothetical protein